MKILTAFFTGMLFGLGLIIAGMTDPSKVIGFLDVIGNWNPSLAFVMVGAILIGAIAFKLVRHKTSSFLGETLKIPTSKNIDRRLILGSMTFGIGWGLVGYCPGPALASLATGAVKPIVFVVAMIAGMAVFEVLESLIHSRQRNR